MPRQLGRKEIERDANRLRVLLGTPPGIVSLINEPFVTVTASGSLSAERVLTGGDSISLVDGGANSTITINLDTPGTNSVSSSNAAPSPHTHAITSSSNPGAAASILASDASGYLQLVGMGIGAAPGSADLHFATLVGITHADGVTAGMVLRADGTRYVPSTLDTGDLTDLAYAVPNLTLGTANAAGSADSVIRSDATILVFDATNPTTITVASTPAPGAAGIAARRDHAHGITTSSSPGAAAAILASDTGGGLTLVDLALTSLTASTVIYADAGKEIESLANATGYLYNDGVGGLSWASSSGAHNILSGTHADSAAAAVVDGDLIIGNVTPAWSRLAISVPAANVWNFLGIENGELRPSWKTASSNPGIADAILQTDSSGYLQLVGMGIGAAPASADLHFATAVGITHADGVTDGMVLRANGTRYIPSTLDTGDLTDLAYATPNLTLSTANAAGAADSVIRSDATILVFDVTNPETLTVSAAAAVGVASTAARRDHVHPITSSSSPGAAASILASSAAGKLTLVDLALTNLTASTVIYSNASKEIKSLANAAGYLTNNGSGTLSWSSAATAAAHNILDSTYHGDTLTGTVVDGDVIIGNATPKWSRLARSVPAAGLRNYLGIANGETRPSWKALFDSTNPATLTVSTVAAPGTQQIAARRDHAHAILSSSAPGAAASILATNSSGYLQVERLGANVSPGYFLHARGTATPQLRLDYDATYYTSFSVSSAGDLTVGVTGTKSQFNGYVTSTRFEADDSGTSVDIKGGTGTVEYDGTLISRKTSDWTVYGVTIFNPPLAWGSNPASLSDVGSNTAIAGDTEWDQGVTSPYDIDENVKGYLVGMQVRDSASASTAGLYFALYASSGTSQWSLVCSPSGKANDDWAYTTGWIVGLSSDDMWYRCNASGTGTLDVYLYIFAALI